MTNKITVPKDIFRNKKTTRIPLPNFIFAGIDSIPAKIQIYSDNDKIDKKILYSTVEFRFKKLKESIPILEEEIKILEEENKKMSIRSEIIDNDKYIDFLREQINDYRDDISINKFKAEIKDTDDFLYVVDKYIKVEVIKKNIVGMFCNNCNYNLEDVDEDEENIYTCPKCSSCNNLLSPTNYIKDSDYGKVIEEDTQNFKKILDKFEGKNEQIFEISFFQKLDEYFVQHGMREGSYYKKLPLTKDNKKEGTSKKLLFEALEYLDFSQYYDETNYISHIYWGWKLPDISQYIDTIIDDYQRTQQVWNFIKKDYQRSASLGTQFRLYVHLYAVGYKCDIKDFKIQNMTESLRFHNEVWGKMAKKCNIRYKKVQS